MKQELIKPIVRVGNSAGVLLPREWLNGRARIELVEKPLNINQDVLEILSPYLEDVIGVYLVGSYARGEQTKDSDVDVVVITKNTKKELVSGKYHISISTLEGIRKTIKSYPELVLPRLSEAVTILNPEIIEELKKIEVTKKSFKNFIEDSERIIQINKEFIDLDKLDGKILESKSVVYSLILRLRGVLLIKCLLNNKKYSKKIFEKWILRTINKEDFRKIYEIYKIERDKKKSSINIEIAPIEKLLALLIKEIKLLK
jgi:predicted nucleotidyltransferase